MFTFVRTRRLRGRPVLRFETQAIMLNNEAEAMLTPAPR